MTVGGKDKNSAARERKARLAAELRANLKRRKKKTRAAAGGDGKTAERPEKASQR